MGRENRGEKENSKGVTLQGREREKRKTDSEILRKTGTYREGGVAKDGKQPSKTNCGRPRLDITLNSTFSCILKEKGKNYGGGLPYAHTGKKKTIYRSRQLDKIKKEEEIGL